jgi:phosphosulfolactate synthase (CoM biosynthesis protein A)
LGFILIGIFADDPKPENENSEQKTEFTVATKQEQIKTEVSKAASTPEKEESATDNSEAEKMQDAIDIYYEKIKQMQSREEAISEGKEKLSSDEKKKLITSLINEYFTLNKADPQKAIELQSQYLKDRRDALDRCAVNVNDLTDKHKECLARFLAKKADEEEVKKAANKLKLNADLYKQIQQDCVMQEALLKLKEAAYDLLIAAGGEDYIEELQKTQKGKIKSTAEILSSIAVKTVKTIIPALLNSLFILAITASDSFLSFAVT